MKYLLDANIVIDLLIGTKLALYERVSICDAGDLALSTIAFGEVAVGSLNGKPPPIALLDRFLLEVELLPFDEAAARAYAGLPFKRASFDRLLAAHAIAADLILVTGNEADFADIPGLRVENWTLPITA